MFKVEVSTVKSLEKRVTDEGEVQPIKGTVVFNVPLEEAGTLNGKTCYIYTTEEHELALGGKDVDMLAAKQLCRKVLEEAITVLDI